MNTLRRFLIIVLAAAALAACGGDDNNTASTPNNGTENPPVDPPTPPITGVTVANLTGEWHLTEWSVDSEFQGNIYLEIKEDNKFFLYQNLGSDSFEKLTGTFLFDETTETISGRYTDGTTWGSAYTIHDVTAKTMKWTAGKNDTSLYTREPIPSDIAKTSRAADSGNGFRYL